MRLVHFLAEAWSAVGWTITWQLALLAVIAWLCQRLTRVRSPRVVHALWWFVLLAPLMLAPLRLMLARQEAAVVLPMPARAARVVADVQVARFLAPPASEPAPATPPAPSPPTARPQVPAPPPPIWERLGLPGLVALLWLTGCAAILVRLLLGHRWVRAMLRESVPVRDEALLTMLRELREAGGVAVPVALHSSAAVGAPVLYGWRRPAVVLPQEWLRTLSAGDLRALLAHEVAHTARRDFATNMVQRMLSVPLFFHPALWLANQHIALAREQLCDAWALEQGADPMSYARSLAGAARRAHARFALVSVGAAERKSTLFRRVEAIMGTGDARRFSRKLVLALGLVLVLSAVAFAAVQVAAEESAPTPGGAAAGLPSTPSPAEPAPAGDGAEAAAEPAAVPEVTRATAFALVTGDGRIVGQWGLAGDGSESLSMYDADGVTRAALTLSRGKSEGLTFFYPGGGPALSARVGQDGLPEAALFDRQGRRRAAVSLTAAGAPRLSRDTRAVAGGATAPRVTAPPAGAVQSWQFELVDAAGHIRGKWFDDERAGEGLVLWDANGIVRIALVSEGLTVFDTQGRMVAWAGFAGDGNPKAVLLDRRGRWRAGVALADDGTPLTLWDQVGTAVNGPSGPAERGRAAEPEEWVVHGLSQASPPEKHAAQARRFELVDRAGRTRGKWYFDPEGSSGLAMWDGRSALRVLLDFAREGGGGLTLLDGRGKIAAWAGVTRNGNAKSVLLDGRGRWRASASLTAGGTPVRLWDRAGAKQPAAAGGKRTR